MSDNINVPLCLLGKPIDIPYLGLIYPLTIDDIFKIGLTKYNQYLSLLMITTDDILSMIDTDITETSERIEAFDFLLLNALMNEDFRKDILAILSLLFKETTQLCEEGYFYIGHINDCRCLNVANFGMLVDIIKLQNCIDTESKDVLAKNEKQREFLKQLKKAKAKYNKLNTVDVDIEISNIISSVCAKHPSINLFNVGQLTMYQLINQFKRLSLIDDYFINVESLMHGATGDDVKITHWASTLLND